MEILDFMVIGVTIVVLRMFHRRDDEEVPGWILKICSCLKAIDKFPGYLLKICKKAPDDDHDAEEAVETKSTDDAQTSMKGMQTTLPEENPCNWKSVARIMDKFFFRLVTVITVGVVVGCVCGVTVH